MQLIYSVVLVSGVQQSDCFISLSLSLYLFRRRQWHPTPALLPGKSHGRRSLVGCGPWGCWELDMTERLHFRFSLSSIGERNGTHSSVLAWRIPGTGEPGGRLSSSSSSRFAFQQEHILTGLPGMSPGGFLKDIALDQGSRAVQGCFYLPYLPVSVSWVFL